MLWSGLESSVGVPGGPEREPGVLKLEILSFVQPLWCEMHIFLGPTWHSILKCNWVSDANFVTLCTTGGPKKSRTLQNPPERSPGALGRVSGGPERGSLEVS